MLSEELINKLGQLFDQTQREALEFTQGNRNLTIEKQISYYFGEMFPKSKSEDKFLDGFALTIQKNIPTILKIAKLKAFAIVLSDPKAFRKANTGISLNYGDARDHSLNNTSSIKEYLKHGKTSEGGTERGDDYSGIQLANQLEDQRTLTSDLNLTFKVINKDKKLEEATELTNKELIAPGTTAAPVDQPQPIEPSWTLTNSSLDRTKSRDSSFNSQESIKEHDNRATSLTSSTDYIEGQNTLSTIETDIYDLRNLFWNSFFYLFNDWGICQ